MDNLDTLVRRVDEDRWLASRFATEAVRARLTAIYAVNYEIARTPETVREPALGAIRLEWWRSALEDVGHGRGGFAHPALSALSAVLGDPKDALTLARTVEARAADLQERPFETWDVLETYLDDTAGVLITLALRQCAAFLPPQHFVEAAGRAWGYTGLLRAAAFAEARGRSALPRAGGDESEMRQRAASHYEIARSLAPSLPNVFFPAYGYVALVPGYLQRVQRGQLQRPLLGRQMRLLAASATGRI